MVKKSYQEEVLERIANEARAAAAQAEILKQVITDIPNYLETSKLVTILSPETVILEHYQEFERCWQWFTPALLTYLEADQNFNELTSSSLVHRYVVLPNPSVEDNWYRQRVLRQIILMHLHVQLWFGVICGIFFVDPKRVNIEKVIDDLNFASMPEQRIFYDVPGFHSHEELRANILRGHDAKNRFEEIRRWFVPQDDFPIWIFYDEDNFEPKRLKGWRWYSLRVFFHYLYGKQILCAGCGHFVEDFNLDHIAPISRNHFQTLINFQPLCPECNTAKRDIEGDDPFGLRLLLPEYLRTRQLDDILRLQPPWLGKIGRPRSKREMLRGDLFR
jgi:hypothetical protein